MCIYVYAIYLYIYIYNNLSVDIAACATVIYNNYLTPARHCLSDLPGGVSFVCVRRRTFVPRSLVARAILRDALRNLQLCLSLALFQRICCFFLFSRTSLYTCAYACIKMLPRGIAKDRTRATMGTGTITGSVARVREVLVVPQCTCDRSCYGHVALWYH